MCRTEQITEGTALPKVLPMHLAKPRALRDFRASPAQINHINTRTDGANGA